MYFFVLGSKHREVPNGAIHRERLGRRMIRIPALQNAGLSAPRTGGGQPEPPVAPEHRVVVVDARLPDPLGAPVGRRLEASSAAA